MGENSKIEWTDHTWSPWRGCTKVSDGCKNCYAESLSKRNPAVLGEWGPKGNRVYSKSWDLPMKWNRAAAKEGKIRKVFPSLCDPFDEAVPDAWRDNFFTLADATEHLTWLVLTKRPQEALRYAARVDDVTPFPENVWIGVSAENQKTADERIPLLIRIPAVTRFVSAEPLLGPVNLEWEWRACVDWVIVGGESGHHARPMHPDWALSLRDQCQSAAVNFLFKQWGEYAPMVLSSSPCVAVDWNGRVTKDMARDSFPKDASAADRWHTMYRVGKKNAGRTLDGREWNEVPF